MTYQDDGSETLRNRLKRQESLNSQEASLKRAETKGFDKLPELDEEDDFGTEHAVLGNLSKTQTQHFSNGNTKFHAR